MFCRSLAKRAPSPSLVLAVSRTISALKPGDLLFVDEPRDSLSELDAAIDCVGNRTIDWLEKRGANVLHKDTAIHVAIVKNGGSNAFVIDATRGLGVRQIPLPQFLSGWSSNCKIYHGRVQGIDREQARCAVAFAERKLGLPYSEEYLAPVFGGEEYYCSSLIDYAYREALGRDLVFTDEPFPLLFEPRSFWERYYSDRQKQLPTCVGSNPTLLLHSLRVKYYETAFGRFSSSRDTPDTLDLQHDVEQYLLAIEALSRT